MFGTKLFKGGVHPPENKITSGKAIETIKDISHVKIPMNMHIGAPCKPIVKVGDHVDLGQVIGEPSGIAVPTHASVSGTVKAVKKELTGYGTMVDVVEIENDFNYTPHPDLKKMEISSKEDFIAEIKKAGLVGLGGAGFPTHIKMSPPKGKEADLILVNCMECEPYITSDDRQMVEETKDIVDGVEKVLRFLGTPKAIMGIEDNKPEAYKKLTEAIKEANLQDKIEVKQVPVRYPQGAEKTMIQAITGRIVPAGGLPHDVKVLVLNVSTVNAIHKYLEDGMPLVSKVITISGDAVKNPGNYRVPIGSIISEVVEKIGGFSSEPGKVLMGGPMMGVAISDLETPILKQNNAILAFKDGSVPEESNCIRCGRCVNACPMELMPLKLDFASRNKDFERLDEYAVLNCVECGSCSYVCPAKRQLVQNIRTGKQFYRAGLAALKAEREKELEKEKTGEATK